jgi:hypothetical protein
MNVETYTGNRLIEEHAYVYEVGRQTGAVLKLCTPREVAIERVIEAEAKVAKLESEIDNLQNMVAEIKKELDEARHATG